MSRRGPSSTANVNRRTEGRPLAPLDGFDDGGRDRDDFVDEAAAVDGRDRPLVAGQGEPVLLLARDAASRAWFSATSPVLRYTSGY